MRGRKIRAPERGALDRVLFVRVDDALLEALDRLLTKRAAATPGLRLSRSDVARQALWEAIGKELGRT